MSEVQACRDEEQMSELSEMKCTACRGGEPTLGEAEIRELRPRVPDWELVERDGIKRLERVFGFSNFAEALVFTIGVGGLAEEEGHHPDLFLAWGKVRISLYTHKVDGLTRSDFILAAKIDQLE